MLLSPFMNRLALALCFVSLAALGQPAPDAGTSDTSPAVTAAPPPSEAAATSEDSNDSTCPEGFNEDEGDLSDSTVLGALQVEVDGRGLSPTGLEFRGLHRLTDAQVRRLVGAPSVDASHPLTATAIQTLLHRLARTGLFARVEPRVRVSDSGPALLEVTLEEHPTVTSVALEGLQDLRPEELWDELFERPSRLSDADDEEEVATVRVHTRHGTLRIVSPCPPPRPSRGWLARQGSGGFRPGILLGGLDAALDRVLKTLRKDDGYLLATVSATLSPDGRLVVTVDEGHLESVEVRGVDDAMAVRVREALGLQPGDVLLRSDARRAMKRLESRLPFLRAVDSKDLQEERTHVRILEEREPDGTRRYRTQEEAKRKPRRHERVEFELGWRRMFHEWSWPGSDGFTLEGKRLIVHVRPRPPDLDVDLLPVHTQVTGFAPGLSASLRIFDFHDRVHTTLDGAFFIPLRLGGQHLPFDPEGTRSQRRVSLLGGAKVQLPALGIEELGAQVHDFVDTLDRWRLGDFDSYFYSFLINRPDRDYFRRQGFAAFATWRWARSWLAGVEVRGDTMSSLQSFTPPLSLFRHDDPPFPNAPVDAGRFRSAVVRLEYSEAAERGTRVGSLFRTPETTLFERHTNGDHEPALRGFMTLEVGEGPGVDGVDTRFWKWVGDVAMDVPMSWQTGLSLRLRAALGHDLPLQKQEALGGWTALRGYGFKEFRGADSSVLATAEYRWQNLGIFADLGSVHYASAWLDPKLGMGASFHFGDSVRFDAAWRIDDRIRLAPEARLLFNRTF
ncbi:outer membrane protein assembly factor [Corallococcus sp. EGB]|uniref:outer membrane protein assembly factor n=1 Tax=Corallococcus sp. EGB TaxID=1521117 RepID=UPI001CBC6CF3|nr:outer membrane protein assembly factor [Corallococcus sp. EGB]